MLVQFEISSGFFEKPRKAWVQADPVEPSASCLIFLDAEFYIQKVGAPSIVDAIPGVTSVYLSHVDILSRARDFACDAGFAAFLANELPVWIEQKLGRFDRLFVAGLSLSGLAAIFAGLEYPAVFDGVLAQSPSTWWNDEWLRSALTQDKRSEARIWISVGDRETEENVLHSAEGLFQKSSQRESVRRLAEQLEGRCRELHHEEFAGGHDMACWARELPRALAWLLRV